MGPSAPRVIVGVPSRPSIQDDIDSYMVHFDSEITISEAILARDDSTILGFKDTITMRKYKGTLSKLIKSHQLKIQALSENSIKLTDELASGLTEALHNLRVINNLCNTIYGKTR